MEHTRIVHRMDSDDDEADLESLRLAALRSRNQKKHSPSHREVLEVPRRGDVRYVSRRSESERSVVQVNSQPEVWASDQESSSTDYEEIDLNDTNDIEKNDNSVEVHDADEFDDVSSGGQSGTSAKDDDFQIVERNEVSVEDDFDVNEDGDKNSSFGDVDIDLENNVTDDDDTVKTNDVNDNMDECGSLEVTEVVESESGESEVEPDPDDEDLLDTGIDIVDNITITIQNDTRSGDSNDDDRGQECLEEAHKEQLIDKELLIDQELLIDKELQEGEEEMLAAKSVSSTDQEQQGQMDERQEVGGTCKSKENGNIDDKAERKAVVEEANERNNVTKMNIKERAMEEDGSSSDSSSSSDSDSDSDSDSSDDTSSSESQSDNSDVKTIKSKVICETRDKKASVGKNNISTASKEITKRETVENKGSRTSPKGEGQVDHDRISIGGGSSDKDSDFDEDNQPVVKSTVRMRRLYSNTKGKKRSRSSSKERLPRQQRSRSRSRTDRSRSRGRLRERNQFQDWSQDRWRRSRSQERVSYRNRYSNREYRWTRSRSRDNLSNRSSRKLDHGRTRSRSRDQKDTKTSSKSERSKQRKDEKVSKEPEKTREQKDSKLRNSTEKVKRVEERKQETNGRVENLSPKEPSKLTSSVRKKGPAASEKRRDELDIYGKTAGNRYKKGEDTTMGQAAKGLQKEDLRERLKPRKPSEPASSVVSKSSSTKPVLRTMVKLCDSKSSESASSVVSKSSSTKPVLRTVVKLCDSKSSDPASKSAVSKSSCTKPVLKTVVKLCDSKSSEPASKSAVSKSSCTKPVLKTVVKLCDSNPSEPARSAVSKSISTKPVLKTVVKLCDSKPDLIIVKKLKTETKLPESRERDLDARIAKIKQQNEAIMQRRREVDADKQKYFV